MDVQFLENNFKWRLRADTYIIFYERNIWMNTKRILVFMRSSDKTYSYPNLCSYLSGISGATQILCSYRSSGYQR